MATLKPFVVKPKALHELIIMPQFGDVLDDGGSVTQPSDEEGDWMIMDNVVGGRSIMDLFGGQNILKRRDATCKLIYGPVGRLSARKIYAEALYAAVEDCVEEFFQGAFEQWEMENWDLIFENVMPILEKGIATDLYCNKYFGDVSRASDTNGIWSWNRIDGIFTQYKKYIASGVIPSAQTFSIAAGALTPAAANTVLQTAYDKQDGLLMFFDDDLKAFYVDKKLANAYHQYLIDSGNTVMGERMSGAPMLFFKGIRVKIKKWDGPLAALNSGTEAHACILTLRGNWLYGTDSKYGGGPRRNEAVRIWYSQDDDVWKRQVHLKSGTEIAAPQHTVFGITSF